MFLFALFAIVSIVGIAVSLINNKSQQDQVRNADSFDQDSVPRANVGDDKPVIFGTVKIKNATTITDGNFRSEEVYIENGEDSESDGSSGGGKGGGGGGGK